MSEYVVTVTEIKLHQDNPLTQVKSTERIIFKQIADKVNVKAIAKAVNEGDKK